MAFGVVNAAFRRRLFKEQNFAVQAALVTARILEVLLLDVHFASERLMLDVELPVVGLEAGMKAAEALEILRPSGLRRLQRGGVRGNDEGEDLLKEMLLRLEIEEGFADAAFGGAKAALHLHDLQLNAKL